MIAPTDFKKQFRHMVLIALGAIGVTAVGSLIALGLNAVTDDWFACIAFCLVWTVMAAWMICRCIKLRLKPGRPDVPAFVFWAAMYGYCLAALVSLGIHAQAPWFMIVGILFAVGTLYVTAAGEI